MLEEDALLGSVSVSGEISNLKLHSSGHMYFSLKDDKAVISATMFKWARTKLQFAPQNGMKVVAVGKITLYEPSGQYQINVTRLVPAGIGELYAAYEQLKARLGAQGLFDASRKKPIPKFPRRVGVVTSKTGAAVQDILNILRRRYPMAQVVLCPVQVQGDEAPAQIAAAIDRLCALDACDVMIVGRGGGSIEDLWAFNTEVVAMAVVRASIPVISAVGHETDTTICDYVADLRAPTPSAAAELAVPDCVQLMSSVDKCVSRMRSSVTTALTQRQQFIERLARRRCLTSPEYFIEVRAQRFDNLTERIEKYMAGRLSRERERMSAVTAKLAAMNPMSVLARGYAMASADGAVISSAQALRQKERFTLVFSDGSVDCAVTGE